MLRSLLFCPADSPSKMERAAASAADAVILDLEDAVAPERKRAARLAAAAFLKARAGRPGPALWVRINPLSTPLAAEDVATVAPESPAGIVLPKPRSANDVEALSRLLDRVETASRLPAGGIRILPIAAETPRSLFRLDSYLEAGPRMSALTWGGEDLSGAVGSAGVRGPDGALFDLFRVARALCLAVAAARDVPAIETVWTAFRDREGLEAHAAQARREGFAGMLAIHPDQLEVINRVFTPSEAELDEARRLVALFEASHGAAALAFDGRMVDVAHLKRARRLLRLNLPPA